MVNVNPAQQNWTSGELSPKMYGRTDVEQYYNGARKIENFLIETQGGLVFRGGFHFIAETKDNLPAYLTRFQYSDEQAYMLEFTEGNIRIYKDRGVILDGGGLEIDVTSPYTYDELFELKFAQNATDLYITHQNHPPKILTRTSHTSWTLTDHAIVGLVPALGVDDYPSAVAFYEQRIIYGGSNNNPETMWFSKSGDTDDFTIGTGADDGIKYTIATGDDVNRVEWMKGTEDFLGVGGFGDLLRVTGGEGQSAITPTSISIKPTNTYGSADINPVSKKQIIIYVQRNQRTLLSLEIEEITGVYRPVDRNLFADHITKGGITQLAFQEGRPDVLWATRSDGVLLGLTIAIEQKVSGWQRHTTDGEFISVTTTPRVLDYDTTWVCVKRNVNGVDKHYIEYLNDNLSFPDRADFITNDKSADDSRFQRALFESQKNYIHLDSALTFDGSLEGVDAGANITVSAVAGLGVNTTSSAAIFSVGDIGKEIRVKSVDGTRYGVGVIDGYTSATEVTLDIEVDFDSTDVIPAGEWYLTSDIITGLGHLEGEEVKVVVDGAIHPDATVTSGTITLDQQASVAHIGLGYEGIAESMNLEGGTRLGTAQTKKISMGNELGLKLLNTSGLSFGTDYYNLEDRLLRQAVNLMDNPAPLFTGDETVRFKDGTASNSAGWSREKRLILKQTLPLPASIQLVTPYFTVSEA